MMSRSSLHNMSPELRCILRARAFVAMTGEASRISIICSTQTEEKDIGIRWPSIAIIGRLLIAIIGRSLIVLIGWSLAAYKYIVSPSPSVIIRWSLIVIIGWSSP